MGRNDELFLNNNNIIINNRIQIEFQRQGHLTLQQRHPTAQIAAIALLFLNAFKQTHPHPPRLIGEDEHVALQQRHRDVPGVEGLAQVLDELGGHLGLGLAQADALQHRLEQSVR